MNVDKLHGTPAAAGIDKHARRFYRLRPLRADALAATPLPGLRLF